MLDQFIEKCGRDGKLDSEGSFSVDSIGALRKTLASALPEPHYYLFQLLQALNQAQADDIKVAIGRRENRITFDDTQGVFTDLDKVSAHFKKGLSVSSNDPIEQLMSGLVTSLGCHVSSAELHYDNRRVVVTVNGLSLQKLTRPASKPVLVLRRSLEKGLSYSWSRIWGARKEEFRIRKAFEYTPRPLLIAGLATTPRAGWRRSIEGDGGFCLMEIVVPEKDAPNHVGEKQKSLTKSTGAVYLADGDSKSASDDTELAVIPTFLLFAVNGDGQPITDDLSEGDWAKRRWTFCITNSNEEQAEIQFIRHGFSIEKAQVDLGIPGLQVVAPADDLDVDATGYQLVQNSEYEARIEEAKKLVGTIKDNLDKAAIETALSKMDKNPQGVLASFSWL